MTHVLHIIGTMNFGGIETWLMRLLGHIDREQLAMDFCCLSGEPGIFAPEIESLGGHVFPCKLTKNLMAFNRQFKEILGRGRYQVIHSHVHHFSGYLLRLAASEGIPIRIAHSHTTRDGRETTVVRNIYRKLLQRFIDHEATVTIAASELAAASLFGADWRSDPRCQIVRCGIDLSPFGGPVDRLGVRRSLGLPAEAKVIGYVGRFDPAKNCAFLPDMAKEVLARRSDVRFLLIGDGPLRTEIEQKIKQLGLSSQVILTGWRSDAADLMLSALDLFCLPSLYEGLPVAAIEAQAAGLSCLISTDVTPEIDIVPGAVSFLPRSAGAAAWAEEICRKIQTPRIDSSIAIEAVRNKGFDVESSLKALMRLYTPSQPTNKNS